MVDWKSLKSYTENGYRFIPDALMICSVKELSRRFSDFIPDIRMTSRPEGMEGKAVDMSEFAKELKELRERCGLSQEKLAERIGVSRQVVTKWESGGGTPKIENLKALADCFGVSLDRLLGREETSGHYAAAQYRETIDELRLNGQRAADLIDRAIRLGVKMAGEEDPQ